LLGTSLAFAGYGAYKHLKAPHVTRVKIKPPKMDLKATGTIGKDVKVIQDGVTKANKVVYNSQKIISKRICRIKIGCDNKVETLS